MDTQNTAIILIDNDNDFMTEGGKLHVAVKDVLDKNNVISNLNHLMAEGRKEGVLIIHVPIMFSDDYHEMGEMPYGIFNVVKSTGAFQKGTWGARVADVLEVKDSDIIVDGKSSTCAFATTNLKNILDEHNIQTIALGGLLTNICIESTLRTAYDLGYEVFALTDCSATLSEEQQENAIKLDWPLLSKPVNHQEFLSTLIP